MSGPPVTVIVMHEGPSQVGEGFCHFGAVGTTLTCLPGRGPGYGHIF